MFFSENPLVSSISAQVWRNISKNTKNSDFGKNGLPAAPLYLPPWPPWGSKKILGGFWHLFQLKFEEMSPKIPRMQILRILFPCCPPFTRPPGPFGNQKIFWLSFCHLFQLKFEEISPKIQRMQILRKLVPLLPPVYLLPWPPGGQKEFWEVSGI